MGMVAEKMRSWIVLSLKLFDAKITSMTPRLPQYTKNKMKGNIGEALVQFLLSKFSLVHKIDGSNDVGNDFICELIRDQSPTNLLFYVQVKFTKRKPIIKNETIEYWKGSPIPVYVFWIKDISHPSDPPGSLSLRDLENNTFYKRYTPVVHGANDNQEYIEFQKIPFFRDLLEDYLRTQYRKGQTPIIRYRDYLILEDKLEMGLPRYGLHIENIAQDYSQNILKNGWSNLYSLALILHQSTEDSDKLKAIELLKIALSIITSDDREQYSQLISELERRYEDWTNLT